MVKVINDTTMSGRRVVAVLHQQSLLVDFIVGIILGYLWSVPLYVAIEWSLVLAVVFGALGIGVVVLISLITRQSAARPLCRLAVLGIVLLCSAALSSSLFCVQKLRSLKVEADALVLALDAYKDKIGKYPASLSEEGLSNYGAHFAVAPQKVARQGLYIPVDHSEFHLIVGDFPHILSSGGIDDIMLRYKSRDRRWECINFVECPIVRY